MATYDATVIAEWFIRHDLMVRGQESGGISNLKLQKLLYYAQSAHLAICNGEPLFSDPVLAWEHGPVVRKVYDKYKKNRANFLKPDDSMDLTVLSADDQEILADVYDSFGQYDAWKLRDMTHNEDPWKSTKRDDVISHDKMRAYFEQHYLVA